LVTILRALRGRDPINTLADSPDFPTVFEVPLMPKALCLFSLVASILVVSLFVLDAIAYFTGQTSFAVLGGASPLMDLTFAVLGGVLAYLSWTTYREQR
jgi:hypothetical protein